MTSTATARPTAAVTVTNWQVDPSHTQVEFAVRHLMISTVRGRFSDVNGSVRVPDGDFGRAEIEAKIGVQSIDTREPQRDAHLKSSDFLDAERFPEILFRSRRVESDANDPDTFVVVGDLSIHGVTREITLTATTEGHGRDPWGHDRVGFSLKGKLSRKDFGLTWNQVLETGGVAVGDEVKISIDTEIIAKPERAAA